MTVRRLLTAALLGAALTTAAGCGIRPTAVPVDAGAPASRTACPTPVRVPEAAEPTPSLPSAQPTLAPARPTPGAVSKSPAVLFSASPGTASPSATACP
ncbi:MULTISPECIES: hypothetical protein [unclassified Kitasatospora]|uniref:hypothetical protein n=1 Tax=unclassified Kitasatospora TaxID=2633591 RepID=UPI00070AF56A|nr:MULTISPECIES: hypothetical protein [unclassified Kitasatospora]KQV18363.1 hypothetical protein ASC99_03755 [Kitasatospora sp. Root107]KRB74349.1 hypothetical protein ASE03_17670 [Kitasatospora sp. Root187]